MATLRGDGCAAATIQGHLAYLKVAIRWAAEQKLIPVVPKFPKMKVPKGASKKKIRAAARIGVDELHKLLKHAPNDGWRLLIALAWQCGLRRCEARNVRGQDVDLRGHKIIVPFSKSGEIDASVFTTPDLERMLLDRWPDGRFPDDRLITREEVSPDPYEVTKHFKRIAKAANVKGGGSDGLATLHDLRRAFGSRWAAKVPAQVLQRMMRHADIKTTMDFYAEVEGAAVAAIWGPGQEAAGDEPAVIPIRSAARKANATPTAAAAAL